MTQKLPVAVRDFTRDAAQAARNYLEAGNDLPLTAFVGNEQAEFYPVFIPSVEGGHGKIGHILRYIAAKEGATVIVLAMECWSPKPGSTPEQVVAWRKQYGPSLEDWPAECRVDTVTMSVETPAGLWLGHMPIEPKGEGRTFGDLTLEYMAETMAGNFVGLIPRAEGAVLQ